MPSLDKLSNSFHAAGTNGYLDLSLSRCASCCPTNCQYSTWSGSWISRFPKESADPNRRSSAGWMPARTGKSSVGVGRQHPVTMRKASLRMLSMRRACVLRHQSGTCTPSKSSKSLQQRNSGGEFFVQSLKMVTESERSMQLYPKMCWDLTRWE